MDVQIDLSVSLTALVVHCREFEAGTKERKNATRLGGLSSGFSCHLPFTALMGGSYCATLLK